MKSFGRTTFLILLLALPGHPPAEDINGVLKQAAALESEGNLKEAVRLYRILHAQRPERVDILFRLEAILSRTGHHEEAIALLKAHLEAVPRDIGARFRLGDALFSLDRHEEAFQTWDLVLDGATREGPFALVAERYRKHNLPERAMAVYRRAREALNAPRLFAREMAEAAERLARYPEAVAEYLVYLQDKPQYISMIESHFRNFAREGEDQEAVFGLLAREVRAYPDDHTRLRLFVEYALAAGYAEPALQVFAELPDLDARHRALLYRIAAHALQADAYATAAGAYRMLLDTPDRPVLRPQALLGLARAREGMARPDSAGALYRDLIERYPGIPQADEARYRLGLLLHRTYNDTGAALETFRSLVHTDRATPWRSRALFQIAEIMLLADRLEEAGAAYVRIAEEQKGREDAAQARFGLAECRLFAGDFEGARKLLDGLLSGPVNRFALNDALALSILVADGAREGEGVLEAFATAYKLKRQNKLQPALEAYEAFLEQHPGSRLLDRALAARIELLEALGRYPEAIGACRRLLARVPGSPLCPWAQMALARIHGDRLGQYYDALRAYETVLIDYPRSLEADAARDRMRALRKKIEEIERQKETG